MFHFSLDVHAIKPVEHGRTRAGLVLQLEPFPSSRATPIPFFEGKIGRF